MLLPINCNVFFVSFCFSVFERARLSICICIRICICIYLCIFLPHAVTVGKQMTRQIIKPATPGSALDINALSLLRRSNLSHSRSWSPLALTVDRSGLVWSVRECLSLSRVHHGVATAAAARLLTCNSRRNKTGNCKRL